MSSVHSVRIGSASCAWSKYIHSNIIGLSGQPMCTNAKVVVDKWNQNDEDLNLILI